MYRSARTLCFRKPLPQAAAPNSTVQLEITFAWHSPKSPHLSLAAGSPKRNVAGCGANLQYRSAAVDIPLGSDRLRSVVAPFCGHFDFRKVGANVVSVRDFD